VTAYNANETVGSAVGIPIGTAGRAVVSIDVGALNGSLTSVTYTFHASGKQTGNTAGELTQISTSSVVIAPADASSLKLVSINVADIVPATADKNIPLFLFVKRVQVGAVATSDSVMVDFVEDSLLPQKPNAGTAAYTLDI
jgi:hypothetical protein